ncbi:MAG TPA: TolC family protein [Candidatus Didemnitutus sp.]|nr:TolC family protein [Candidatus Didemnitutus sp.]
MKFSYATLLLFGVFAFVSGCTVPPSTAEKQAQRESTRLGQVLHSPEVALPAAQAPLADYVRYAVLRHPQVLASYSDWRASVLSIAPTRALPDPQLTFEADVADTLMTFMPGLMFDFMTPGKRRAMAEETTAASQVAYRAYVATVLETAAGVRKAWLELAYVDEALRLREDSIAALDQATAMAGADYVTGRGMSTLESQFRLENEVAKVRSDLAALGDRKVAARTRFKSALGLATSDVDPAWPQATLAPTVLPSEDELWRRTLAANPQLGRMRSMVEMAVAGVAVARKAGTPDFTLGAMADLKADPLMIRPTATVSLPIWREKIRANVAAAEARRDAAVSRVSAEQLSMAAALAQMLYMVRESDRMIAYIDTTALPNYQRLISSVEAGYQSGMTSPGMIPETRVMALGMRIERVVALRDRENAVTDLLLMTADIAPAGAPLVADFTSTGR